MVTTKTAKRREPFDSPRFDEGFLAPETKKVKVAGFKRFVGRRRALQRVLPVLEAESGKTGVVIWGMGGLGKSSLAARLCDRVERRRRHFRRAVLVGALSEARLLSLIESKFEDCEQVSFLKSGLSLKGRLQSFFAAIDQEHPLLLVLDDFEDNAKLDGSSADGFRLRLSAWEVLNALGSAIQNSHGQTRIIITTRYWSARAFPDIGLIAEQLPQMAERVRSGEDAHRSIPWVQRVRQQLLLHRFHPRTTI